MIDSFMPMQFTIIAARLDCVSSSGHGSFGLGSTELPFSDGCARTSL